MAKKTRRQRDRRRELRRDQDSPVGLIDLLRVHALLDRRHRRIPDGASMQAHQDAKGRAIARGYTIGRGKMATSIKRRR